MRCLLATFGRMEKCNTSTYLDAMSLILKSDRAHGSSLPVATVSTRSLRCNAGLQPKACWTACAILGPRQSDAPALNKSVDIYCDTYPWVGGQSLLDAMQAGRPIVAMLPAPDTESRPYRNKRDDLGRGVAPIRGSWSSRLPVMRPPMRESRFVTSAIRSFARATAPPSIGKRRSIATRSRNRSATPRTCGLFSSESWPRRGSRFPHDKRKLVESVIVQQRNPTRIAFA